MDENDENIALGNLDMPLKTLSFIALLPILPIGLLSTSAQAFNPEHLKQLLKTNQCQNCDLSNADLQNFNLSGANLQGTNLGNAKLTGSNLSNANLEAANLQSATLTETYLFRANLTGTNFSNSALQKANLRETTLVGTNFSGADLRSVNVSNMDLSAAFFTGSNLSKANLSGTIAIVFKPSKPQDIDLFPSKEWHTAFIKKMLCSDQFPLDPEPPFDEDNRGSTNLHFTSSSEMTVIPMVGANWSNVDLSDADLSNALLPKIDLTGAKLNRSNLKNACLFQAQVKNATFEEADLTGAKLTDVKLTDAKMTNASGLKPQSNAQKPTKIGVHDRDPRLKPQYEAKLTIGTLNRAQQAYYLENDRFTSNLESTGVGIKPDSPQYLYRLFVAPDRYPAALQVALPKTPDFPTFLGLVHATKFNGEMVTIAVLCLSEKPATPMPLWNTIDYKNPKKGEPIACPKGFIPVN